MFIVGGIIAGLGILTPLRFFIFVPFGALFVVAGFLIKNNLKTSEVKAEVDKDEVAANDVRQPENVNSLLQVDPIELEFGYGIIPLADVNQGGDLLDRIQVQ